MKNTMKELSLKEIEQAHGGTQAAPWGIDGEFVPPSFDYITPLPWDEWVPFPRRPIAYVLNLP